MTDPNKKVKNTLFNASVTGVTIEDFSQNAVIMPAKEKPPLPIVNITADTILQRNPTQVQQSAILDPVESLDVYPSYNQQQQPYNQQQQFIQPQGPDYFQQPTTTVPYQEPQEIVFSQTQNQTTSKVSSVISTFSSYLKLGSSSSAVAEPEPEIPFPAPAGIDNLISQNNSDQPPPPVPLFPLSGTTLQQPEVAKPPTGPVNTFRRPGLKKAVYAPPPGLSGGPTSQVPLPAQPYLPPQPIQGSFLEPQPATSPPRPPSSNSSFPEPNFSLPNQFKPIAPLPSNFSYVTPQVPYPQHSHSLYSGGNASTLGPVMDAIPDNEALMDSSQKNEFSSPDGTGYSKNMFQGSQTYRPVYHHWFFKTDLEGRVLWQPFSMMDSLELEQAFTSNDLDPDKVIPTDGGRYDVNILRRQRSPVYWTGKTTEVRRCSWFYKSSADSKYNPYEENVAARLEEEYKIAFESNQWQREVELGNGETVMFHGPDTMVLFPTAPNTTQTQARPRVVKRGFDEFDIDEGESTEVDHVLFIVHGIGSVCDLKFRTVEEVVDDLRNIALQLIQTHYKTSYENGRVHRVEVLPISWHHKLHSTGIDEQLKNITLTSIPKLREFTNDTILDVLLYTSPVYGQNIISTVGDELNRIFSLFQQRNPTFNGGVSLGGHSLGSLILFDLLAHQKSAPDSRNSESDQNGDTNNAACATDDKKLTRRISYMMGNLGAGQPKINYPQLNFHPKSFFALGSPIGMFITVRGLNQLGEKFALPTCPAFFNIFHPYDPVAYRIEALINPELTKLKPVLIPHHKGRKRLHLELKETMAKVGADLKQKVFESMKTTWNSLFQLAMFSRQDEPTLEAEVNKTLQKQLEISEVVEEESNPIPEETDISVGNLNKGRRVDYILQEAPLEFFNEYIFALKSHVCYWDSEDTVLLILKEIYNSIDVTPDDKIPQQSMTIERPPSSPKPIGMDPTYPITTQTNLPPPPTSGFMRKT